MSVGTVRGFFTLLANNRVAVLPALHGKVLATDYVDRFRRTGAQPSKSCVLTRISANKLRAYLPLGGPFWGEVELNKSGSGPYSWNATAIKQILKYVTAADAAITFTGFWSTAGTSDPAAYVGGIGRQATNPTGAEYIEVTVDGPGDLYVVYTGRTTGGYLKVEIDGDTEAANLLPSNGTYRYIDTYTSTDLQHKRAVMVASGMTSGAHTVRITATSDKNVAVTGTRQVLFEAFAVVGDAIGIPGDAGTDAPLWSAGEVVPQWAQRRTLDGNYYSATVGGTTGGSDPTHTAGTATDGSVTWQYMATSSYAGKSHTLQAAGSQLEYAYRIKPNGATVYDDVGGLLHGNETRESFHVALDGLRVQDVNTGSYVRGRSIQIVQAIKVTHSETASASVNQTLLTHNIEPGGIHVSHEHDWQVNASVGYFYNAMWPLLHWYALEARYGMMKLWTPQAGEIDLTAYYGMSNPIVGKKPDFLMAAKGQVLMPKGTVGGPASPVPGEYTALFYLHVAPPSVNGFENAADLFAGMAANIAGTTAPGFSSVVPKMYFERASSGSPVNVAAGEKWTCSAYYGMRLIPNAAAEPWK